VSQSNETETFSVVTEIVHGLITCCVDEVSWKTDQHCSLATVRRESHIMYSILLKLNCIIVFIDYDIRKVENKVLDTRSLATNII